MAPASRQRHFFEIDFTKQFNICYMNLEGYETCKVASNAYQFSSDGRRGVFEMRIIFEQVDDDVYNLAFGPWNPILECIDDSEELRNGDMDKILATVGRAAIEFLKGRSQAGIIATGRTLPGQYPTRNRKYRMGIGKHIELLTKHYDVYGFVANRDKDECIIGQWPFGWVGRWKIFDVDTNFDAFLIKQN
jgi:hypothetical protein